MLSILEERLDIIRRENGRFCVFTEDGTRNLGCHDTEAGAKAQLAAIEATKQQRAESIRWEFDGDVYRFDTRDDVGDASRLTRASEELAKLDGHIIDQRPPSDVQRDAVFRIDVGRLDKIERTPQGGIRVPARLTRTGVLVYTKHDGSSTRELRHPDDVFDKASMASLEGATITDLHPSKMIEPSNWKSHTIGHVAEGTVKQDGRYVAAMLAIEDQQAIRRIEDGELHEVSSGYRAKIDARPGDFEGESFDTRQRGIVYNHVAVGPKNWGRAGNQVALRLDAAGDAFIESEGEGEETMKVKVRIDGVEQEIEVTAAGLQTILDREAAKRVAVEKERDEVKGKIIASAKELEESKAKLDAATKQETLDKRVAERKALEDRARKVLGKDEKFDGDTDRQVMEKVALKKDEKIDLKETNDDVLRGMFMAHTDSAEQRNEGLDDLRRAADAPPTKEKRTDEKKDPDADAARAKYIEDQGENWQKPLAVSKDRPVTEQQS